MERLGWSQTHLAEWLAERTGRPVQQSYISHWLSGRRSPEVAFAVELAKAPVRVPTAAWAKLPRTGTEG